MSGKVLDESFVAPAPPVRGRDAALLMLPPLFTCVEIDGIVHDRAPGEGSATRCRIVFDVSGKWHNWRLGLLREEGTLIDCMTCLVRAAR